jgi:uncharacterized membrane protein YphA (DoxX/SURF4 family)
MPSNPLSDIWSFVTAETPDFMALGAGRYLVLLIFWGAMIAGIWIAAKAWIEDPRQRTGSHLVTAFMRIAIGTMWFQGMLWKLPLFSTDNGLYYWMTQMGQRAAFDWHQHLVTAVYLPFFNVLNPLIFLAEFGFAVCLMLGLGVRLISLVAVFFTLHLWLGIYRPGEPAEWPWSYIFLVFVHVFFIKDAAGRSLGLDALLRQSKQPLLAGGTLGRIYRLAS